MATFSERIGAFTPPALPHVGTIAPQTQNSIWNAVLRLVGEHWDFAVPYIAQFFLKEPVDSLPYHQIPKRDWLRERFYALPWYQAFDFVEFLADRIRAVRGDDAARPGQVKELFNAIFEDEHVGYRFVNGVLAPISSPAEAEAIDGATRVAKAAGLDAVATHINAALALLSKRPSPDYRNSIKESISAVESAARQLAPGAVGSGLSGALDELSKRHGLHPALRKAFVALYGYTSDGGGIRHALLEDSVRLELADAQFMVVACSAFAHYLMLKAES